MTVIHRCFCTMYFRNNNEYLGVTFCIIWIMLGRWLLTQYLKANITTLFCFLYYQLVSHIIYPTQRCYNMIAQMPTLEPPTQSICMRKSQITYSALNSYLKKLQVNQNLFINDMIFKLIYVGCYKKI